MDPALFSQLDGRLERIEDRQDAMTTTLLQQTQILAEQQQILREHMRRSEANEELIGIARADFQKRLEPVERHIDRIGWATRALLWLGGAAGAATAVWTLIKTATG